MLATLRGRYVQLGQAIESVLHSMRAKRDRASAQLVGFRATPRDGQTERAATAVASAFDFHVRGELNAARSALARMSAADRAVFIRMCDKLSQPVTDATLPALLGVWRFLGSVIIPEFDREYDPRFSQPAR